MIKKNYFKTYEELIKKINPHLKFISKSFKNNLRYISSDDILQELYFDIWQKWSSGKLKNKNISYIKHGCYFFLKNFSRKYSEKIRVIPDYNTELLAKKTLVAQKNLIERKIDDAIFIKQISDSHFSMRDKEIIELTLKNYSTREIGKKIGISHSRVIQIQKKYSLKLKNNHL